MISCRDLWYTEPEECTCLSTWDEEDLATRCPHNIMGGWTAPMWRGSLRADGRLIVTDAVIALYATELAGCTEMPPPLMMTPNGLRTIARPLLAGQVLDDPSTCLFRSRYLDLLEPAGYLVRPLRGDESIHAVLSMTGIVGLLMPMKAGTEPTSAVRAVSV